MSHRRSVAAGVVTRRPEALSPRSTPYERPHRATLEIYQEEVSSASPFALHGGLLVDLVGVGAALDADDYHVGALRSGVGVLTASDTLGWKTLDVASEVQNGLDSLRNRADFRLRFANFDSNSDLVCNFVGLNDSGDDYQTGHLPALRVTYRRP